MKKLVWIVAALGIAQQPPIGIGRIIQGEQPTIAIPDLRGSGEAQNFMAAFNETLRGDVEGSGLVKVVSKSMYPAFIPQQPSDFVPPPPVRDTTRNRNLKQLTSAPSGGGRWMNDWSGPPVNAKYMAFGYTAVSNGVLVLQGWLFDVTRDTPASAQLIGKRYLGSVDEAGARKVAHEFAADIIATFGGQSLFGSKIFFVSDRTGHKEIWVMDPDGKNQRQVTRFNNFSIEPSVAPDGTKIAFTSWYKVNPGIFVFSVEPVRDLGFYNQRASVNSSASFTPDGKQIVYSSSAPNNRCCRIFMAGLDGSGFRVLAESTSINTEPKVNPKTGGEILFVSGRSGPQQIYKMNIDGADVERVTDGTGEAANPSWHPNGQVMAFSWTRGYSAGAWNVFWMDIASRKTVQLTHGEGKNENPTWAPDGAHLVFGSTRTGRSQIYTMLADGTQVAQLTTQGTNTRPVWGK
jgi:TolB protein